MYRQRRLPESVDVVGKGNIICILHNYTMTDSGRLHDHFGNAVDGSLVTVPQ